MLILNLPRNYFFDTGYGVHKVTVMNDCKIRVKWNIMDFQQIWVYDLNGLKAKANPIATTVSNELIASLPASGDYFIVIKAANPARIIPYTITVTTLC